jgi:hypothetical protein
MFASITSSLMIAAEVSSHEDSIPNMYVLIK